MLSDLNTLKCALPFKHAFAQEKLHGHYLPYLTVTIKSAAVQ